MQQEPWTYINPFDRRFGPDFFKQVPEKPGVYWMQDSRRSLLYVGKSTNLRSSLSSYRFIQPHEGPKQLQQLMEEVRSLGWSPTETEEAAGLLEKQLILRHRPSFNKIVPKPKLEKHTYLGLKAFYPYIQMNLHSVRISEPTVEVFGIFRNRLNCHKAITSLNRLLWWVGHQEHFTSLPKPLAKLLSPLGHKTEIYMDEKSFELLTGLVREFWAGQSKHLLELFEDTFLIWSKSRKDPSHPDHFFINWINQDIEYLNQYYLQALEKKRQTVQQNL